MRREDYWPFVIGVYVGGLATFPFIFGFLFSISIVRAFGHSILTCFVFVFAHTRNGEFLFRRFIGGILIVIFLSVRSGGSLLVTPGILTIFLAAGYGRIAVWLARKFGISTVFVTPDPSVLHTFSAAGVSLGGGELHEREGYVFGDDEYQRLVDRTYEVWKSGESLVNSDHVKKWAQEKGRDGIEKDFKPHKAGIQYGFTHLPLESDEYILAAYAPNLDNTCLLLTNRYFYFFGGGSGSTVSKQGDGRIALDEIIGCKITKGFVWSRIEIHYGSGSSIEVRECDSTAVTPIIEMLKVICEEKKEKNAY